MLRKRAGSLTHATPERPAKVAKTSPKQKSPRKEKKTEKSKKGGKKSSGIKKKPSSKFIPTSKEHYALIDALLQFNVVYNHATGVLVGSSGFSCEFLPFFAFPVLTRKPVGRSQLPVVAESNKSDVGYFLGAGHPGFIRLAIIEAFCKAFPKEDPKAARWENWEVWANQSLYYPPDIFNRKPATLDELADDILTGREFGGLNRTQPKIVSTIDQKLWSFSVSLAEYFDGRSPIPADDAVKVFAPEGFLKMNHLLQLHEDFKTTLAEKKDSKEPVRLKKGQAKKRLEKAQENDDSSDEDEDSDSSSSEEDTGTTADQEDNTEMPPATASDD